MGDLVLTHDEVNPVMKKLLENGIEVTALHNHLLRAEPGTMYMHVAGHGDSVKLGDDPARGLAREQDADRGETSRQSPPAAAQAAPEAGPHRRPDDRPRTRPPSTRRSGARAR